MARPRSTTTDAIIDIAAQIFLERGFHNTSIEDVAEAAEVSKPTLYSYIKSKQWLLDQIILRVITELGTAAVPWQPGDVSQLTEQLDNYLDMHIERATKLRVFYRILYSEETEMSAGARARWRAFAADITDHFAALLAMFRDEGRVAADLDLHAAANLFIPMLVSLHRWYQPDGPVDPQTLRELAKKLLSGIVDL